MSVPDAMPPVPSYTYRLNQAVSLQRMLMHLDEEVDTSTQLVADRWLAGTDPQRYVGSVHHTVPRFILDRWSRSNRVRVYSRIDDKYSTRNVKDLGVRDFYTFIAKDGSRDSTFEALLGTIESPVADITRRLLSAFNSSIETTPEEKYTLAQFAAFQSVRTMRRRRELELHGEWLAKTLAQEKLADADLRKITITPHQNDVLSISMRQAKKLIHYYAFRPLEIIFLKGTSLYIGDEPILINGATLEAGHRPDCFMTNEQFEDKLHREARKKLKRRKVISRVVHFRPTQSQGIGVALEIILPISPRALLWWGPLQEEAFEGGVRAHSLSEEESKDLANHVNRATLAQALDWVVSSIDDDNFLTVDKPALEPLMTVCDGDNAAAAAVNTVPSIFRPTRLT